MNINRSHCGLTRVSRKVENQAGQEGEEHTGNDDVDDEVERQSQHEEVVSDVQVGGLGAAGVVNPVLPAAEILHHPLAALHEVTQVRAVAVLGSFIDNNTTTASPSFVSIFNILFQWFSECLLEPVTSVTDTMKRFLKFF